MQNKMPFFVVLLCSSFVMFGSEVLKEEQLSLMLVFKDESDELSLSDVGLYLHKTNPAMDKKENVGIFITEKFGNGVSFKMCDGGFKKITSRHSSPFMEVTVDNKKGRILDNFGAEAMPPSFFYFIKHFNKNYQCDDENYCQTIKLLHQEINCFLFFIVGKNMSGDITAICIDQKAAKKVLFEQFPMPVELQMSSNASENESQLKIVFTQKTSDYESDILDELINVEYELYDSKKSFLDKMNRYKTKNNADKVIHKEGKIEREKLVLSDVLQVIFDGYKGVLEAKEGGIDERCNEIKHKCRYSDGLPYGCFFTIFGLLKQKNSACATVYTIRVSEAELQKYVLFSSSPDQLVEKTTSIDFSKNVTSTSLRWVTGGFLVAFVALMYYCDIYNKIKHMISR